MSDAVTIRVVETETILLEDTDIPVFTGSCWLKLCTCFILFFGIGWSVCNYMNTFTITPAPQLVFGIGVGVFFTFFFGLTGLFHTETPAYTVSLQGYWQHRRVIIKTTPGNDQVAICKAAKELEVEALVIVKKERELEQIAQKCNKV